MGSWLMPEVAVLQVEFFLSQSVSVRAAIAEAEIAAGKPA